LREIFLNPTVDVLMDGNEFSNIILNQ
jgi:hypothetical protein